MTLIVLYAHLAAMIAIEDASCVNIINAGSRNHDKDDKHVTRLAHRWLPPENSQPHYVYLRCVLVGMR